MSANDLFGCALLVGSSIWDAAVCRGFDETIQCNILGLFGVSSMCSSVFIVVVISIDRFIMVHWPLKHRARCSINYLLAGILSGFVLITSILMMPLFGVGEEYYYYDVNGFCSFSLITKSDRPIQLVLIGLLGATLSLCVIITIVCNIAMMVTLKKRSKWLAKSAPRGSSLSSVPPTPGVKDKKRSTTDTEHAAAFQRLAVIIALINLILVLPFTVS